MPRFYTHSHLGSGGGRDFSLGRNIFFCNTLEPRNFFRGIWSLFFFNKFYSCNFQTIEPDFFFIAGLGPVFFFFFASSRAGKFFQKNPARPLLI